MSGAVDWSTLLWIVGLVFGVAGGSLAIGWNVLGWVQRQLKDRDDALQKHEHENSLRTEAMMGLVNNSKAELSEYKTHVAEYYATKQGMAEQTDRIMKGILDLGVRLETRVEGLGTRLDRFYEGRSQSTKD